jgi:eukaryotic-like serine/threonine-protein kinase
MSDASTAQSAVQKAASGPDPLIGRLINDRFQVVALIARGGMGKVYRAEQAPLGRVCALKVLNPNYAGDSDPEFHKRFFLEASIASKLTHPNTVTIFDYGRTDDDVYYIAMEYLEGRTLHRAIREEAPLPEERAAHVARQICRALREAHSLGVIHRDLKPANIYLVEHADEADFVKVLDFGLVKNVDGNAEELTQAGLFMGSPKYMSPEQIRGDKVDARADIYSLGIVLYEMVTGKVPFDRVNSVNILMAHVNEPPPPLKHYCPDIQISGAIEEVIFKCIAKDPNARYSSMDEVLAALKRTGQGAMTGTMMGLATGEYSSSFQGSGGFLGGSVSGSQSGSGPQSNQFMSPGTTGSQSGALPLTGTAMPDTAPPPSKKPATGVLVGVGGVAIALLALGFVATRGTSTQADVTPAAAPSAPAVTAAPLPSATVTASAAVTASAKPPEKKLAIRIESDPSGSTVRFKERDGEEICKETPCDFVLRGDDATKGKEFKVYVTKKGYTLESKTFKVGDEKVVLKLSSLPSGNHGGGARPPPPSGGNDTGFKPVPY